jgi:hypothetical protein
VRETFNPLLHLSKVEISEVRNGLYRALSDSHMIMRTRGDGNCLFRSLSWTLYGDQDHFLELRLLSCKVIVTEWKWFEDNRMIMTSGANYTVQQMVNFTSIMQPFGTDGWGSAWNTKSIAIGCKRIINRLAELRRPQDFVNFNSLQVTTYSHIIHRNFAKFFRSDSATYRFRPALSRSLLSVGK